MRISDWSSDVCSSDLPFRDHHRWRVGVPGDEGGHDGGIDDTKALHPADAQRRIDDGMRISSHPACPNRVVDRFGPMADVRYDVSRSAERRVGKEYVGTGSSRWLPYH